MKLGARHLHRTGESLACSLVKLASCRPDTSSEPSWKQKSYAAAPLLASDGSLHGLLCAHHSCSFMA